MICPKGHDSSETDFCSLCGVKIDVPGPVDSGQISCPDCARAREPGGGNFCENCGYGFSTGLHGLVKETAPAAPPAAPAAAQKTREVLVEVDASLRTEESPEAPADFAPATIRLTTETSLIGRRSEKRGVFPEISLDLDDAVSHRHALISRKPDGSMVVRDIGSSNGTRLNGAELQPLTDVSVKTGDRITLGHWTRISILSTTQSP